MTSKTRFATTEHRRSAAPVAAPDETDRPSLDKEIALQRQVNERLLALWDGLEHDQEADETRGLQVKVATALTAGTGRVARLLRDQRALSGEAAEGLTEAIAQALDELSTEVGVAL